MLRFIKGLVTAFMVAFLLIVSASAASAVESPSPIPPPVGPPLVVKHGPDVLPDSGFYSSNEYEIHNCDKVIWYDTADGKHSVCATANASAGYYFEDDPRYPSQAEQVFDLALRLLAVLAMIFVIAACGKYLSTPRTPNLE